MTRGGLLDGLDVGTIESISRNVRRTVRSARVSGRLS